ncbi:hypothetical protein Tco_0841075 [Tanacetum coccineum]|uniref:Uncharacterized protein n=1 Tax=Tanacetum coccineum TaxID=301880 RepID=A0ABQ5AYW0_9ASTR
MWNYTFTSQADSSMILMDNQIHTNDNVDTTEFNWQRDQFLKDQLDNLQPECALLLDPVALGYVNTCSSKLLRRQGRNNFHLQPLLDNPPMKASRSFFLGVLDHTPCSPGIGLLIS